MSKRLLDRLRDRVADQRLSQPALAAEWAASGVAFAANSERMERRHDEAVEQLLACIRPVAGSDPILHEGGTYLGCWLESTGTISAELLSRFLPSIASRTFLGFAAAQRDDGLLPYKLTAEGPGFAQIQLVTPPARSVWNDYRLNNLGHPYLETMYRALARYDAWLAKWRDTRGTGGVEAFCCYDTGHDLSPRFWHIPDSPAGNDPTAYDRSNPLLPLVAPDLTASVACQRRYLARMAKELGSDLDAAGWDEKAAASEQALFETCFDAADAFFYDRDAEGRLARVQSDILLRVLACEIGDDELFERSLERYLLNTRKFFTKYPFTSIALDDPRYDPAYDYNSWAGPTNFLSLIRAPHAFEHHHRHVELSWAMFPALAALFRADRFPQTLHPFTGRAGYTECYSPAILCLLDFVERLCGVLPRPDGTVWFTCLVPRQIEHRDADRETAYSRNIDGQRFELINGLDGSVAYRDGEELFRCPRGIRIVTDRSGTPLALIGMNAGAVSGTLRAFGRDQQFKIAANEQLQLSDGGLSRTHRPGLVPPSHG